MVTKVSKTKYWIGRTIGILTLVCILMGSIPVQAQGPTYTQLNDVYSVRRTNVYFYCIDDDCGKCSGKSRWKLFKWLVSN